MNAAVIGPGAMGCLFAGRFAQAGIQTTLVDYKPDRADRLRASGVTVASEAGTLTAHPNVVSSVPDGIDLCIVCVKSYRTKDLQLPQEAAVLTIQNGLGNVETICSKTGSARVLAGVTSEAAHMISEGQVKHTAPGLTRFGAWTSCPVDAAKEALEKAGFNYEVTNAPGQTLWEKACISAAINPLTALLDVKNGAIIDIPEVRQLMRDLVVESVKVAATEGYRFEHSLVEYAEEVCESTRDNVSSMLQDIRAGRPTEIEAISGEILRRAQIAALPTPRTRVLWQLLKGREKH